MRIIPLSFRMNSFFMSAVEGENMLEGESQNSRGSLQISIPILRGKILEGESFSRTRMFS